MLFLQFVQYSSSFVGTPKNEIPGAALELCQLKLKQFSPEIFKFSTKHEVILLFSTFLWFLALVCLYLMQARVDWVLIIFGTQVIKKKQPVRPVFPGYLSVFYDYASLYKNTVLLNGKLNFYWSSKIQMLLLVIKVTHKKQKTRNYFQEAMSWKILFLKTIQRKKPTRKGTSGTKGLWLLTYLSFSLMVNSYSLNMFVFI